ncbi:MAG TPA: hypothetical protein VGF24_32425 [Vicinamibacterales bacterium]
MRSTIGASGGVFPRELFGIGGFELEYARARNNDTIIETFGVNLLFQSTVFARRLQVYGSMGAGVYGETTADGFGGSGEVGSGNFGGGMKIHLAGPLRLRLDYRLYVLGHAGDASTGFVLHKHPQRSFVGFAVAF